MRYQPPEYGHPIPDDAITEFESEQIRHFVLRIEPKKNSTTKKWTFGYRLGRIDASEEDPKKIDEYVKTKVVDWSSPRVTEVRTPWDLTVCGKQCYVVLDLDPDVENWHFVGRGMTSKEPTQGCDFGLYWVTKPVLNEDGDIEPQIASGEIDDDCTRIFFGVARRKKGARGHQMNFHTAFVTDKGLLPVIYDPDVKNEGGGIGISGGGNYMSPGQGDDKIAD